MSRERMTPELLADREAIRDLVLAYSRAIDRKDPELLADLYTADGVDTHGNHFDGSAADFVTFMDASWPNMPYSGHHVCNHLISVNGDEGEGEVYALAYHVLGDGNGGLVEDIMAVRYLDHYRRCADGLWRFTKRLVAFDMATRRPYQQDLEVGEPAADPSHTELKSSVFARGKRP